MSLTLELLFLLFLRTPIERRRQLSELIVWKYNNKIAAFVHSKCADDCTKADVLSIIQEEITSIKCDGQRASLEITSQPATSMTSSAISRSLDTLLNVNRLRPLNYR